jgi:hypothetical protein
LTQVIVIVGGTQIGCLVVLGYNSIGCEIGLVPIQEDRVDSSISQILDDSWNLNQRVVIVTEPERVELWTLSPVLIVSVVIVLRCTSL